VNNRNYGVWFGPAVGYQVVFQEYSAPATQSVWAQSTTALLPFVWYHVAATMSGNQATVYINGVQDGVATRTGTAVTTADPLTFGYAGFHTRYPGVLDDVRIYNRALSATEVAALAAGRYSGGGGGATFTLGADLNVNGTLAVDNGTLATATRSVTAAATDSSKIAYVNTGTLSINSGTSTLKGGLNVAGAGTLDLTGTATLAIGSGKSLAMDGTLKGSNTSATIKSVSGSYTFQVGSAATSTPTLNISGLAVKNTDTNGMWINANTGSVTTFTNFNNLAFSNGTAGGNLLQIYATSLNLVSNGCTFDASTTYTVKLVGDGFTVGSESTQTRALFGGATCSAGNCQANKSDDDSNNDGVPSTTTNPGGSVVQFVSNAPTDTAGTIEGFPTAAITRRTLRFTKPRRTWIWCTCVIPPERRNTRGPPPPPRRSWGRRAGPPRGPAGRRSTTSTSRSPLARSID
jgi:hypothetical protein